MNTDNLFENDVLRASSGTKTDRLRRERLEGRQAEYQRCLRAVDDDEPAEASYQSYLKAVLRMSDGADTTNSFLINLNQGASDAAHVEGWSDEHYRTIGRLIREGIVTPELDDAGVRLRMYADRFPPDDRDLYEVALNYIAHFAMSDHLDDHMMRYRLDIYRREDRQLVRERLQQEGYLDAQLRICRRPPGSTAEYESVKWKNAGEAEFSIVRADDGCSLFVRTSVSIRVGPEEGYGESGPVNRPTWTSGDGMDVRGTWPDSERQAARTGALHKIAEIAEKALELYPHRPNWNAHVPATARRLRNWAEHMLGTPMPKILPTRWVDQHERALRESRQSYEDIKREHENALPQNGRDDVRARPDGLDPRRKSTPRQFSLF